MGPLGQAGWPGGGRAGRRPSPDVTTAATAIAQAEIIQDHTLETTEGRTWAGMDREDEMRPYYLQAVTLRTSPDERLHG